MKSKFIALPFVLMLVAIPMTGCPKTPETEALRDQAVDKAREAGQAIGEYTLAMKDEFQKASQVELEKLDKQLDEYRAKAKVASDDAKEEMNRRIKDLEVHRENAQEQLNKFADSSKDAWAEMKVGLEKAMIDLKAAFANASESFQSSGENKGSSEQK